METLFFNGRTRRPKNLKTHNVDKEVFTILGRSKSHFLHDLFKFSLRYCECRGHRMREVLEMYLKMSGQVRVKFSKSRNLYVE